MLIPHTDILFDVLDENIAFCTIVILPFSARKNGLRINGVPQPCKGGRPSRYFKNDPIYIIGKVVSIHLIKHYYIMFSSLVVKY